MKKRTKKDQINIFNAYMRKCDEYRKMSLEELKELLKTLKKGLTYHDACLSIIEEKEIQERLNIVKDENKEIQT